MTTTELIELLKEHEHGGATGKSREVLFEVCDKIIHTNDIEVVGTGDGLSAELFLSFPSAQPDEVTPHRNYKYLSDYWCECGWHLGKKGDVNYCPNCGKKVKWDG